MRKKLFLMLTALLLLAGALTPPVLRILEENGVIFGITAGNTYPEPEYKPGVQNIIGNEIEFLRYQILETYGNYMPGNADTVSTYNKFLKLVNKPLAFLGENKVDLGGLVVQDTPSPLPSPLPTATTIPRPTGAPDVTDTPTGTPADTSTPTVTPTPARTVTSVTYQLLKTKSVNRLYTVNMEDSFGNKYSFIEAPIYIDYEVVKANVDIQIAAVNRLYNANKNVNFHIYVAGKLQDWPNYNNLIGEEYCTAELFEKFMDSLDPGIVKGAYRMESIFDRVDNFYHTDHHWNQSAANKAYNEIVEMMGKKYEDFGEPRAVKAAEQVTGAKFYGSFSRSAALKEMYDDFYVFDYDLPKHKTDGGFDFYRTLKRMKANPSTSIKANIYEDIFPASMWFEYPENNTGRNLLILGDSYSQALNEVVASHFDCTYVKFFFSQLRELNYNKFIEENNITDVLILEYSERVVFDALSDCRLKRIIVE